MSLTQQPVIPAQNTTSHAHSIAASKQSVLGTLISPVTYDQVVARVIDAAKNRRALTVTAAAVHAVMLTVLDPRFRFRVNQFDIVTPDGQPVRWALNLLHGTKLHERVYGPTLTLHLCRAAEQENIPVYFYGSTRETLDQLTTNLRVQFPNLSVTVQSSAFRQLTAGEQHDMYAHIQSSGAGIVFVGLGCPRQEIWAYESRNALEIPVIAVGAAFDFIAGIKPQAPVWMQDRGLEWLFRLISEPSRLWKRYLLLNPLYLALLTAQWLKLRRFDTKGEVVEHPRHDQRFG